MIPINDLQNKIYVKLCELENVKIYDEVIESTTMPFVNLADYTLQYEEYKDDGYIFEWDINIYSTYEGKKEVNNLLASIIDKLLELNECKINEKWEFIDVRFNNSNTSRSNEGFYSCNIKFIFEIGEV